MVKKGREARQEMRSLVRDTRRILEAVRASGVNDLPVKRRSQRLHPSKAEILDPIRQKALRCTACRLCKGRKSVVFGEGSLDAELVFVGEGPGQEEDLQGRPFVGAAGRLLANIIEAMGLKRQDVYITNVVKCRPPMNRPPEPDEITACHPYLEAQLTTIQPKVICALGKTAATALLGTEASMGQLRGRTFEWHGIPLVVSFHPAYLLRNPGGKSLVWADMQRVLGILRDALSKPVLS